MLELINLASKMYSVDACLASISNFTGQVVAVTEIINQDVAITKMPSILSAIFQNNTSNEREFLCPLSYINFNSWWPTP